ncbi:MAG: hypothetical protein OXF56_03085 [Rhodobacteraceae bacterium]|nr:hypothetical protein [Paracoccaceae bacterium]
MAGIETVHGGPAAFGVAWGRISGAWRANLHGTAGSLDVERTPPRGTIPAAAWAVEAVEPGHAQDACMVGLVNDDRTSFLTVVITDGAPVIFSEKVHDTPERWLLAIEEGFDNDSVNRVYVPEGEEACAGLVQGGNQKLVVYDASVLTVASSVRPVRRSGRGRVLLLAGAVLLALGGSAGAGWYFYVSWNTGEAEADPQSYITEVSRLDVAPLLAHCVEALSAFWPMAPEWVLQDEGCVLDPQMPPRGLPSGMTAGAYAFRTYVLPGHWNEYLAGRAADTVTARFSGDVLSEPARRVLYMPVERAWAQVATNYAPPADVEDLLDPLFAGMVTIQAGQLPGRVAAATTTLDLRAVLERFQEVDLEPVHIRRGLDATKTEFRIRSVQLHTETIRVPRAARADTQELVAPN